MLNKFLTNRQKQFVEEVVGGSSSTEAYRASYNTDQMSTKTIWEAASRLSKNPKVIAKLDELRAEKDAEMCMLRLSYEHFIISELLSLAVNSKSGKVRIKALELLGKTIGLFATH